MVTDALRVTFVLFEVGDELELHGADSGVEDREVCRFIVGGDW